MYLPDKATCFGILKQCIPFEASPHYVKIKLSQDRIYNPKIDGSIIIFARVHGDGLFLLIYYYSYQRNWLELYGRKSLEKHWFSQPSFVG
mmetsp:Transcript_8458/g.9653  ORF Transcript_8458/g.9653 Transcript_8458/m.9653 type:complete len:90 (+) Transcript_8458:3-272(+)